MLMYSSDFNDTIPPYFSYQGKPGVERYMASIKTYFRNEFSQGLFRCYSLKNSQESSYQHTSLETVSEDFGYTHPNSLRALTNTFMLANKPLTFAAFGANIESIPYLRDQVVVEESKPGVYSSHGNRFNIVYLDAHAKRKSPIELAKDL